MIRLLTQDERPSWLPLEYGHRKTFPNRTYKFVKGNEIIAIAGFRMCEGNVCLFEGLATNPNESSESRKEAIKALTEYVPRAASRLGYKLILALTSEPTVIQRAKELGWVIVPKTIIAQEL
jgi:hypothetical protein